MRSNKEGEEVIRYERLIDLVSRLIDAKRLLNQGGMIALNMSISSHQLNEALEMVVNEIEKTAKMEEFVEKAALE